jgi:hypothetical protein
MSVRAAVKLSHHARHRNGSSERRVGSLRSNDPALLDPLVLAA